MLRSLMCLAFLGLLAGPGAAAPPLQTFTVKDYLQHQWTDEIVHFPISYPAQALPATLALADEQGKPYPCQVSGLALKGGKVTGTVWTVVSLPPRGELRLHLVEGRPMATRLRLERRAGELILRNQMMALRLPLLPGKLAQPVDLTAVPAPLLAVAQADSDTWLGGGTWVNEGEALQVKEATSSVVEEGPVRVTVRYRLTFTDGRFYQADVALGHRQDCALFTDDSDVDSPQTAFRFSFQPGLGADRVYWCSNYWREPTKGLQPGPLPQDRDTVVCTLRPWSFWWDPDIAAWAGVFREGSDSFVGMLALRPHRWSPDQWEGFARTAIPLTAGPGGRLEVRLGLSAARRTEPDGDPSLVPLHREWALTVGTVAEHVVPDAARARLRHQLIKYSEFPLDEVKDYGFDYTASPTAQQRPFLIFNREDIQRVRRIATQNTSFRLHTEHAESQIAAQRGEKRLETEGWRSFYDNVFVKANLAGAVPQAYLATGRPEYGRMMAAAVKGATQEILDTFLENPARRCLGGYGPWFTPQGIGAMLYAELIADTGLLTAEEQQEVGHALVFAVHVYAHPDFWNNERGLCSANPNMTSSIRLSQGILALYLHGHPDSESWLKEAEKEFRHELREWVSPGGAWIENPGYQAVSLSGMLLLAQALRNATGRDYFADPQFQALMDYYGFLLTPPDSRFPPKPGSPLPAPMTLPPLGDGFPGFLTPFNGWMAAATAQTDPAFSARQQFFWKQQGEYVGVDAYHPGNASSGFIGGMTMAVVNPELPAAPPEEVSRGFPGFGSVMRTSWTDAQASYLCHRTGPNFGHYHNDVNSVIYYAKGAPLCLDPGYDNRGPSGLGRAEDTWYHNLVSFDPPRSPMRWGPNWDAGAYGEARMLQRTLGYSYGLSKGRGNQEDHRHVLFVKSQEALGATYVVIRDRTVDGQAGQEFYWHLWCLSKAPAVSEKMVHFPGQFGVDLDVHVLSPARLEVETDYYEMNKNWLYVWASFDFEQHGMHLRKMGSAEDFFTVLYPRAAGQGPAEVTSLAQGAAVRVGHMEGVDVVLLSPGKPTEVNEGEVRLAGEMAFARRYNDGSLRLALVKAGQAAWGDWELRGSGPVAVEIRGREVTGESSGEAAQIVVLSLPPAYGEAVVTLDGKSPAVSQQGREVTLTLPPGSRGFTVRPK